MTQKYRLTRMVIEKASGRGKEVPTHQFTLEPVVETQANTGPGGPMHGGPGSVVHRQPLQITMTDEEATAAGMVLDGQYEFRLVPITTATQA